MKDYEVVGYVCEDGVLCRDCGDCCGVVPVFAGSEEANEKCVACGEPLTEPFGSNGSGWEDE